MSHAAAITAPAPAAPTCCEQAVNWSFGMSTSYVYDFGDPEQNINGAPPGFVPLNSLGYASLEQDEAFNIDLVQLGATGQRGALSYGAKIDYGDLAKLAGDSSDGDIALQEAYIAWEFSDGITATAGRFGGFELPIARLEGKWKMSQNRPAEDRVGAIEGLRSEGGAGEAAVAEIVAAAELVASTPVQPKS